LPRTPEPNADELNVERPNEERPNEFPKFERPKTLPKCEFAKLPPLRVEIEPAPRFAANDPAPKPDEPLAALDDDPNEFHPPPVRADPELPELTLLRAELNRAEFAALPKECH